MAVVRLALALLSSSPLPLAVRPRPSAKLYYNMPPRGSEGLDFTPVLTHYLFLLTTILAVVRNPAVPSRVVVILIRPYRSAGSSRLSAKPRLQHAVRFNRFFSVPLTILTLPPHAQSRP